MVQNFSTLSLDRSAPSAYPGLAEEPSVQHSGQGLMQVLLSSETATAACKRLLQELGRMVQPQECWVGLLDPHQQMTQSFCWRVDEQIESFLGQPACWDRLGYAALQTQLTVVPFLRIDDLEPTVTAPITERRSSRKKRTPNPPPLSPTRAALGIQTCYQGRQNGIILLTRSHPHTWTDLEIQLLQSFAPVMAIAISQAQLEQQHQQQNRAQRLIDQLVGAIRAGRELEQIFEMAVVGLGAALHISRGMIFTIRYNDPRFNLLEREQTIQGKATLEYEWRSGVEYPEAGSELTPKVLPPVEPRPGFALESCQICQQLLSNAPQLIALPAGSEDAIAPDLQAARVASIFALDQFPSLLLLPLENQGTVLGGLVLQRRHACPWQAEEILLARLVAAQLSTAIMQGRTLRQVHALVDERTAQLRRSLDVQAKLYEKTRQQVEQLRRMNQVMEEFLSTVSHELLTPLTSMKLAIRMLQEPTLTEVQRDRYLTILEQQCAQETRLINDLLALQKLESKVDPGQLQQIDLRLFIRDLCHSLVGTLAERQLSLELDLPDRPLLMRTDADSLNRILTELITNAKKYSDAGSTIAIQVAPPNLEQTSPEVVLIIRNVGAGIAPEEIPIIFEKFRRGNGATQNAIPGIGLGLALVKGLVAHLGGRISAISQPLQNSLSWETCFTVRLPQTASLLRATSLQ